MQLKHEYDQPSNCSAYQLKILFSEGIGFLSMFHANMYYLAKSWA